MTIALLHPTVNQTTGECADRWHDDFCASVNLARAVRSDLAYLAGIMEEAGNDKLSARLDRLSDTLAEAIESADGAISQMVSDYSQESWNSIGETFKALLNTLPREEVNHD